MDPQQCWEDICEAYNEKRRQDAEELIASLLEWLDNGGAPPQVTCITNKWTLTLLTRTLCEKFLKNMASWS